MNTAILILPTSKHPGFFAAVVTAHFYSFYPIPSMPIWSYSFAPVSDSDWAEPPWILSASDQGTWTSKTVRMEQVRVSSYQDRASRHYPESIRLYHPHRSCLFDSVRPRRWFDSVPHRSMVCLVVFGCGSYYLVLHILNPRPSMTDV